jgi:hypothetical protein
MDAYSTQTERESMTTAVDQAPEVEAEMPPLEALTGHDRCDRCRAQAYVRVELYSGHDLLFCIHHYRQHESALDHYTLRVQDESGKLLDTPVPAEVD